MPQGRPELHEKFQTPEVAMQLLKGAVIVENGVIRPKNGPITDVERLEAIEYLCDEWDYGWEPKLS